jgi:hypothetical protein
MEQDKHTPMSPRTRDLVEWIKNQDNLTVERLRAHMRHINEHYNLLYKNTTEGED